MSILTTLFNEIFFRPLLNVLVFLTGILPFHDLGFAVIILTVLVRLVLFPFTHHSVKAQTKMRHLEPEIARIKDTHKDNQEEQARQIMALYKQHGVNPFSGCVMLLIQLPLLIGLYRVFLVGVNDMGAHLYSFVSQPDTLHTMFFGVVNLMEVSIVLAALAGITQFIQMWLAIPAFPTVAADPQKPDISRMMTTQMKYVIPGIIFIIGLRFAAAVSLYWTTMNVFAIVHEMIVRKKADAIRGTHEHGSGTDHKNV